MWASINGFPGRKPKYSPCRRAIAFMGFNSWRAKVCRDCGGTSGIMPFSTDAASTPFILGIATSSTIRSVFAIFDRYNASRRFRHYHQP